MASQILARDECNEVYQGGLISDVTYRFFENGYLLTTLMFCVELGQWIPVLLSWIQGLLTNFYHNHFLVLLQQIVKGLDTPRDRAILARQVVDFSKAQRDGFVSAYMEAFGSTDEQNTVLALKGCRQHFRAQVTCVRRNRSIISSDQESEFQRRCLELTEEAKDDGPTHDEQMDQLRRLFPKARRWLDWWAMSDIKAMLFPSRRPLEEDSPEDNTKPLPETTNAIESMHRLYYSISEGKKCILLGMIELHSFMSYLEDDYKAVMRGVPVKYGSQTKMQADVSQSMGWVKPRKRKFENDGRPPDTTDTLLGDKKTKNTGGRPKKSPNVYRDEYTTYQSYSASQVDHLKNRCWLAAALESLFALYSPLWLRNCKGKGQSLFENLVRHFNAWATHNLTEKGRLRSTLTNGQTKLFMVANKRLGANFVPGKYASCDYFLEIALDPQRNSAKALKGLFELQED
ncbi:hypothetical protein PTTG_25339 [Puccinia triticina 1-1 BBBD Race 1]|uniref:Uncharacterized protein n=1 Tax=Puccinia triticina (isolate 1-1 / race 1 (BBBD)) TaxID=630390 RepID=A0A180H3X1_PUCT1|nr:hypothetical protein PTTG_25339 [Puccinia triticina 1-1 BBBD Race 1]